MIIYSPDKYHNMYSSNVGGPKNPYASASLAGQVAENHLLKRLNEKTGNNYGDLSTAAIANAAAYKSRVEMSNTSVGKQ